MTDEAAPRLLCLYFPLWGASFDSEGVGLVGGRVMAYTPDFQEWWQVQQSDVAAAGGSAPPVCLVAIEPMGPDEDIDAAVSRAGEALLRSARDAVSALRLFKPGWFLGPEFAERTFTASGAMLLTRRCPGPYRQAFLAGVEGLPLPGYELGIAELGSHADRPGPVSRVWGLLEAYRGTGGNSSAEIALENFHRSFGFQLTPIQRAADLFTVLDAMFGGMSAKRIGRVPLRRRSFRGRVRAALEALDAAGHGLEPEAEAAWLDSNEGGRLIRNAIAHGQPRAVAAAAEAAQERLQAIVRLLLRQYLEFAVRWALDSDVLAKRFRLPARAPLPVAYNKVLETHASGRENARDVLCFRISVG